ncbi:MAG: class I SAM-dependent methyltransferase [Pirellulales bacterium]
MSRSPSGRRIFFREFLRNFETTGAVAPSGKRLAAALARYVGETPGPKRVLEVGPGTGAVTSAILPRLHQEDQFDLVELNDAFVDHLRRRFESDPAYLPAASRSRVIHLPVQELPQEPTYQVIVSGLPLNNFPADVVQRILQSFTRLLMPGGTLSFFEYMAVRPARSVVSGRGERQRLREVGQALGQVLNGHEIHRDGVWLNFPPAWVHHVRFGELPGG